MNKNLSMIFPVPVAEIETDNTEIISNVKQSVLNLCDYDTLNKIGNWCSSDDLQCKEKFFQLTEFINEIVVDYLNNIYNCKSEDFYLTCMWANVHKCFSKHHIHNHPNSFLSGVYYIDTPEGSGDIFFKDPRSGNQILVPDYTQTPEFMFNEVRFPVSKGKLILFPSYLEHGTHLGDTYNGHRISVSFNYMLKKSSNYLTYKF